MTPAPIGKDIEALPLERLLGLEHAMDGMRELTHHRADDLEFFQSTVFSQMTVITPNVLIMAHRAQRGHVQRLKQMTMAGVADAWFLLIVVVVLCR